MIRGIHLLFYSKDPAADRAFIRDVLGFRGIDIHGGWMIFQTPPAELAVHPSGSNLVDEGGVFGASLWLMSDDVEAEVARLQSAGVECGSIEDESWGRQTTIGLPSGGRLGLYEPRHETMVGM